MSADSWFVYILECADGTLYTGITTEIERRVDQHNGELPGGAKYTTARRPVKLLWSEQRDDRSAATKRECAIKSLSHAEKKLLAAS